MAGLAPRLLKGITRRESLETRRSSQAEPNARSTHNLTPTAACPTVRGIPEATRERESSVNCLWLCQAEPASSGPFQSSDKVATPRSRSFTVNSHESIHDEVQRNCDKLAQEVQEGTWKFGILGESRKNRRRRVDGLAGFPGRVSVYTMTVLSVVVVMDTRRPRVEQTAREGGVGLLRIRPRIILRFGPGTKSAACCGAEGLRYTRTTRSAACALRFSLFPARPLTIFILLLLFSGALHGPVFGAS